MVFQTLSKNNEIEKKFNIVIDLEVLRAYLWGGVSAFAVVLSPATVCDQEAFQGLVCLLFSPPLFSSNVPCVLEDWERD